MKILKWKKTYSTPGVPFGAKCPLTSCWWPSVVLLNMNRDSIFKVSLMRPVECLTALTIDVWIHCTTLFCTFKLVIHRTVWVMSLHHVPLCVCIKSMIFSTCVMLAPLLLPQVSSSQQNGCLYPCARMSTQNEIFVSEGVFYYWC